jgi:putative transposase
MDMADEHDTDHRVWEEAVRRESAISDLVGRHPDRLTVGAVDRVASELGLSRATVYRMVERFRATRTVSGLLAQRPGRRKGSRFLKPEQEALMHEVIEQDYLKLTRPPFSRVVETIRGRCRQAGLAPPNWRTIKTRVLQIDTAVRARRRGDKELIQAATPVPDQYVAARALAVVQIDHTPVDVIVVDEQSRMPIGRPWITLAIDVMTRMVTGFYLSLDAPSRVSISLCLLHAVYDKTAWLQDRGIEGAWPVAGLPETLHADNGSDFRSHVFVRACRDHGIRTVWRNPGQPHYGGHIERLIGTQMGAVHLLPGSTFSNPEQRGDYDSEKSARMTLRELERWIGWEIVGHYHQRIHSNLLRPPLAVWREQEEKLNLRLPVDPMKFWISFLPEEERVLRRDGIHFCNIRYWSDALSADLGKSNAKVLIKYDPRDLSRIFVRRPSGRFVEARYRNLSWPAITLWEQKAAVRHLRAQGRNEIDEGMIFNATIRQREIEDEAVRQTAAVRRRRERRPKSLINNQETGSLRGIDSRTASGLDEGSETWRER